MCSFSTFPLQLSTLLVKMIPSPLPPFASVIAAELLSAAECLLDNAASLTARIKAIKDIHTYSGASLSMFEGAAASKV